MDPNYAPPRSQQYVPRPPSPFEGAPVVKWLLIINVAVFLLDWGLEVATQKLSPLFQIGYFSIETGIMNLQIWRLLTFQFLHADFFHILFNMYALYMFGPIIERWWRSRAFLAFYLICGAAGALFFSLLWALPGVLPNMDPGIPLVGASAGIFGVLFAVAVVNPAGRIILLFPPIPMSMRTFSLLLLGIGLFIVISNGHNAGGEAGHLGGALAGFLLMKIPFLREKLRKLNR